MSADPGQRPGPVSWAPVYRALRYRFSIAADQPALQRWFDRLMTPFVAGARDDAPTARYRLVSDQTRGASGLYLDGDRLVHTTDTGYAVAMLLWHVNQQVVRTAGDLVTLHAAGVCRDDAAVVLAAPSGAGKSTLTGELLRGGFDYLTDEVVALDANGRIVAYPKALTLKTGSHQVVPDLAPVRGRELDRLLPSQWEVPADAIRRGAVAESALPRLFLLIQYEPDALTRVTALKRADALLAAVQSSFGFHGQAAAQLAPLADFVRRCASYRVVYGDMVDARETVMRLFEQATSPSSSTPTYQRATTAHPPNVGVNPPCLPRSKVPSTAERGTSRGGGQNGGSSPRVPLTDTRRPSHTA